MVEMSSNWEEELERWLEPFLDCLGHKARRRMCPLYISGLIGPGDRKSVQPMAARLAPGDYDQLHHFIADGVWDAAPLESELLVQADRLVGGKDAVLVIDDTAMAKKGDRSVGVAPQYASSLGKTANCQTLVDHDRLRIPPASPSRTSGGGKKRINGPPPQPSMPAVRHAIVELIVQPRPQRCPYCRRQIGEKRRHE
jgi:DDE superfamily endonuclease